MGVYYDFFIFGFNFLLVYGWVILFGGEWYYNNLNVNVQFNDYGNGIIVFNDQCLYIGGSIILR